MRVHAFVAGPEEAASTPRNTFLFVDRRSVRDRSLLAALGLAYGELLERGAIRSASCSSRSPGRRSTSTSTRRSSRCASPAPRRCTPPSATSWARPSPARPGWPAPGARLRRAAGARGGGAARPAPGRARRAGLVDPGGGGRAAAARASARSEPRRDPVRRPPPGADAGQTSPVPAGRRLDPRRRAGFFGGLQLRRPAAPHLPGLRGARRAGAGRPARRARAADLPAPAPGLPRIATVARQRLLFPLEVEVDEAAAGRGATARPARRAAAAARLRGRGLGRAPAGAAGGARAAQGRRPAAAAARCPARAGRGAPPDAGGGGARPPVRDPGLPRRRAGGRRDGPRGGGGAAGRARRRRTSARTARTAARSWSGFPSPSSSGALDVPEPSAPPRAGRILGPTASGKSALGLDAGRRRLDGEILCCDSVQVYRGLDIGSGKPTPAEQARRAPPPARPGRSRRALSRGALGRARRAGASLEVDARGAGCPSSSAAPASTSGRCCVVCSRRRRPIPRSAPGTRRRPRREGVPALHARLAEVDPEAAARIRPRDLLRISRALEVFEQTGVPMSALHRAGDAAAAARPVSPSCSIRRLPSCARGSRRGSTP